MGAETLGRFIRPSPALMMVWLTADIMRCGKRSWKYVAWPTQTHRYTMNSSTLFTHLWLPEGKQYMSSPWLCSCQGTNGGGRKRDAAGEGSKCKGECRTQGGRKFLRGGSVGDAMGAGRGTGGEEDGQLAGRLWGGKGGGGVWLI